MKKRRSAKVQEENNFWCRSLQHFIARERLYCDTGQRGQNGFFNCLHPLRICSVTLAFLLFSFRGKERERETAGRVFVERFAPFARGPRRYFLLVFEQFIYIYILVCDGERKTWNR